VTVPGIPRIALIDETVTRCPSFCFRKISTAASHCARAAMKFVSAVCLVVIVDVQCLDDDLVLRVARPQFRRELFQPIGPTRAQDQVSTTGRKLASHAFAQARARTGYQDILSHNGTTD
jgi:hypothetical protein